MTAQDFADLQNALMYVFGPFIFWWLACFSALGFMLAVWTIWLGLFKWLRQHEP